MKTRFNTFLLLLLWSVTAASQTQDTLIAAHVKDSGLHSEEGITGSETIKINVPVYFTLLADDFKQQLTAPFHANKKAWIRAGEFALLTGAVAFVDKPLQKKVVAWRHNSTTFCDVNKFISDVGGKYEVAAMASLAAYSFIFKDEKLKTTMLLTTQAYITSGTIMTLVKNLTSRQRPCYYDSDNSEAQPVFHGPFSDIGKRYNGKRIGYSFPSAHTTMAFAAATVFATEYRDKPLVPFLAYGTASLIGLSRIGENKHWATDVLVGAALGYVCGRQVVANYHRYAKRNGRKNGSISFKMEYRLGNIMPGLVYAFR